MLLRRLYEFSKSRKRDADMKRRNGSEKRKRIESLPRNRKRTTLITGMLVTLSQQNSSESLITTQFTFIIMTISLSLSIMIISKLLKCII